MPTLVRNSRQLHTAWTTTDDDDFLRRLRTDRVERPLPPLALTPGYRVHHTNHFPILEQARHTLIGANAFDNFSLAACASFGHEERIRHLGAGHSDHVSRSLLDNLLCHAEINDAANN